MARRGSWHKDMSNRGHVKSDGPLSGRGGLCRIAGEHRTQSRNSTIGNGILVRNSGRPVGYRTVARRRNQGSLAVLTRRVNNTITHET
jgi:hypothetical protein